MENGNTRKRIPRESPRRIRGMSLVRFLFMILLAGGGYALLSMTPSTTDARSAAEQKKPDVVVVYTAPSCEPCERARKWFAQRNVRFEERDVDRNPVYKRELEQLGSRIVPVIIVNGKPYYGFMPAYLQDALSGDPALRK